MRRQEAAGTQPEEGPSSGAAAASEAGPSAGVVAAGARIIFTKTQGRMALRKKVSLPGQAPGGPPKRARRKDKSLKVRGLMALETQASEEALQQDASGLVRALIRRFRASAGPRGEAERLLSAALAQSQAQASRPFTPALVDGRKEDQSI